MKAVVAALAALLMVFAPVGLRSEARCPPMRPAQLTALAQQQAWQVAHPDNPPFEFLNSGLAPNCKRDPRLIVCTGGLKVSGSGALTIARLTAINAAWQDQFEYRSDDPKVADGDAWQDGKTCGDCEDYALGLARQFNLAGEAGKSMALVLWVPRWNMGHASLLVMTSDAGAWEFSVGEAPRQMDWTRGERLAQVPLDGSQELQLYVPPAAMAKLQR